MNSSSSMAFQGASSSSSSFPSSSFGHQWTHDVFLSFRGEDTRYKFTAHLYTALRQKGINTYIDDKLKRGQEISPALLQAIEGSRISIVVLSVNYASSTWCLEELRKILECKEAKQQMVLPVFYEVDPSEVRHQRESFGKALAELEERLDTRVQRWKECLKEVANLSGWHLQNGNESEYIQKIAKVVSRIVCTTCLHLAKYPVGIESRVQDVNLLLSVGMNDTRMLGIFGVGGIGKTTIAKALYNLIAYHFEASCFLPNVRETSNRERGLVQLHEMILSEILGDSSLKIGNVDRGINVMKHRLCSKKVLLVLDDVDQLIQLETLAGARDWFGLGSRIIITTRDKDLLTKHDVDLKYKVKELDHNEAFQLLSWHAFKREKPSDEHVELVELMEHAIKYAGGLPLALTVLGSDLYGGSIQQWKSVLNKCKRIPNRNIQKVLRISYDGLDDNEKDIFLDVACFFKGQEAEYVIKILDSCGFFPDIGIKVLMDKSFISIDEENKVVMHDLLQQMGKEIVRQESPKEAGRRSRLWFHEDVRYVLEENMGTRKIEGILIEFPEQDLIHLSPKAFMKMKQLRLFINRNGRFSGGPSYLPNELRLLDWPEYPLQSLPSNFHGKKLAVLSIRNSLFKELKEGFKNFQSMTIMEFTDCKFLTSIPDVSMIPNLERLELSRCKSLVEVHDSVGELDKLSYLSFSGCSNLIHLPRSLKLRSLEYLDLKFCSSLRNFPEIECEMECISCIFLAYTAIKELPSSIGYLSGLEELNLDGCKNLVYLPSSILQLQHLRMLSFKDRYTEKWRNKRQTMPCIMPAEGLEMSSGVELLSLGPPKNSSISNDDCSSILFPALEYLDFGKCVLSESNLFSIFDYSSTLKVLSLSETDIVSLPASIKRFVRLRDLILQDCKQLQEIVELPENIKKVDASGCLSLESFPEVLKKFQFNTCDLQALEWIDLSGCHKMLVNIGNHVTTPSLGEEQFELLLGGICFPGNRIPDWFSHGKESSNSSFCEIVINGTLGYSSSCEIDINGILCLDEIRGIAFCAVIRSIPDIDREKRTGGIGIKINDNEVLYRVIFSMESDHVWLEYSTLESFKLEGNNLRVKFYCDFDPVFFKSCGVYLVHKHEGSPTDDLALPPEAVGVHLDLLDEVIENSEDLGQSIQLSKRRWDDSDDCNWESTSYQQQKRRP